MRNRWDRGGVFTYDLPLTHPETSSQPSEACKALDKNSDKSEAAERSTTETCNE